jgi:hypothetical protein
MIAMKPSLLASLTSSADAVVDQVLLRGSLGMKAKPRTEVGFVAAITLGGVPGIAAAWSPLLASCGYSLEIHGVFCHASPVVEFHGPLGTKPGCELADLIIVTDYIDRGGHAKRRASLIQAKMASKAKRVSLNGASSKKQLHLYQNWPGFKFREAAYGNRVYSLSSTGNGHSGSFGVIDRHFKKSAGLPPTWTQHDALPTPSSIAGDPTFGEFLARMIGGSTRSSGRVSVPAGSDDWSLVVDLLLKETYKKAFSHAPTLGSLSSPRGVTAMAYLSAPVGRQGSKGQRTSYGWRPPFDGFETIEDDNPGGISVLRVVVSQDS